MFNCVVNFSAEEVINSTKLQICVLRSFITLMLFQNEIEDFKRNFIYPTIFTTEKDDRSYPWVLLLRYTGKLPDHMLQLFIMPLIMFVFINVFSLYN